LLRIQPDAAPTAIGLARQNATERSLEVRFALGDALDLSGLGTQFDSVLDCGLFHVFDDDDDRARFVASLCVVVVSGGRYFMLCFSDKQSGDWGPRRIRQEGLRRSVADERRVDHIEETVLETTFMPEGVKAWLASLTRK